MNPITRNSLIATSVVAVVYIFNYFEPQSLIYSLAVALVMIFAISRYLFGIKFEKDTLVANSKFLLLALLFNLAALSYLSYIYLDLVRALLTMLALLLNYYIFVSLRRVKNLGERASIFFRNVLIATSFLTLFMSLSTLFRILMLAGSTGLESWARVLVVVSVFGIVYFLTYFLSWENGALDSRYRLYGLVCALLCSELAWVSSIWIVNYPVIGTEEKASLGGTPLPAIMITIVYYFLWGLIYHKLEKNLTRKVLVEYLSFTAIFIAILLVTARWMPIG